MGPIATNEFADAVTDALATVFPQDPPLFIARTPSRLPRCHAHRPGLGDGWVHEHAEHRTGGIHQPCGVAGIAALAYCHGTPLRGEIEARDPNALARATRAAEAELARRFGDGPIEGRIEALVVTVGT